MSAIAYPAWRKDDTVDVIHSVPVADPFRYLEDPDAPETAAFVRAQNKITAEVFAGYGSDASTFEARLKELQNYERVGTIMKRGKHAYAFRNTGLQNQDVLYQLKDGSADNETAPADLFQTANVFLDLNAVDPAGTTSLGTSAFSEDGKYYAYGLSKAGSDWQTISIKDTETGVDLPGEECSWVKFSSIAWMKDGSGFFYQRFPPPAGTSGEKAGTETATTRDGCVFYHRVGTPSSEDMLVYANPDQPVWLYSCEVTDDGAYLILKTAKGTDPVSRVYVAHLPSVWADWAAKAKLNHVALAEGTTAPKQGSAGYTYLPFHLLIDNFEADYDYLCNDGRRFYFRTNLGAPKYRVVAMDMPEQAHSLGGSAASFNAALPIGSKDGPTPQCWTVIEEHPNKMLDWATPIADDQLVLCYLKDVAAQLIRCALPKPDALPALDSPTAAIIKVGEDGGPDEIPLPGPGTIAGFSGKRHHGAFFAKYVSFLSPGQQLKVAFDSTTGTSDARKPFKVSLFHDTKLAGFNPADFEATQHLVPSKDGSVKVPLFTVRKKATADKPAPTLLYGYGGFSISLTPSFSAMRLLWLADVGGTYALACLRGGAEYGEAWHLAGCGHNKQNVFDDAFACASYLVDKGYAEKRKVGIMGGSNGGLLALACALQRPDLFGASVAQVPVADMLRFHLFTAGKFWVGEYLDVSKEADFKTMVKYSPLHNVREPKSAEQELPSILITTADHDDRVVPLHSLKMVAQLQSVAGASPFQKRPLLARIEEKAGHGAGKPVSKVLKEYADIWAFLKHELSRN